MTHRLISRLAAAATLILVGQSTIARSPFHAVEACTVAAAGDMAGKDDWRTGAAKTAELIERSRPRAVLALGDLAYNPGTRAEFNQYYDPTWGTI